MATLKYRFIPHRYMQDVAAQLASKTPTRTKGFMYVYDLPELAEEVHQIVLKEVVSKTANSFTNVANRIARPTISRIAWRRKAR